MKKLSPVLFAQVDEQIKSKCESGIFCPMCGQYAKKYRRKFNSAIAKFLIKLYRLQSAYDRYYTTRELYPRDNKASTKGVLARHWGLIEVRETQNEGGAPAGTFKLTEKGLRFVNRLEYVPAYVYIYNGECLGLDGDQLSILEALGNKFDYEELLRGV